MIESERSNDAYKEWLDRSIQEGIINCYAGSDIVEREAINHGEYVTVYRATIKRSGISVAMKSLSLNKCNCDEELHMTFVKEVSITVLIML